MWLLQLIATVKCQRKGILPNGERYACNGKRIPIETAPVDANLQTGRASKLNRFRIC
jgi:hypothetical protein